MRKYKRIVIKVGTKVITSKDKGLDPSRMGEIASQIAILTKEGAEVILVTSGAIGAGMSILDMKKRPSGLGLLQATAAVGQSHLMRVYSELFKPFNIHVGQVLLTQEDFREASRSLNIKHTINMLLEHKAIPVINENDTVATEEIKCGDNDRLSELVAELCQADLLILLTDVDGLLDGDGKLIREVLEVTPQILKLGRENSACDLGTGGMATKLEAARSAIKARIDCVIADGREKGAILNIAAGADDIGTAFHSRSRHTRPGRES